MSTEASALKPTPRTLWKDTDYNCAEECSACDVGCLNSFLLGLQGIVNCGAIGGTIYMISSQHSKLLDFAIGLTAGAIAVDLVFLSFSFYLRLRTQCCGSKPFFEQVRNIKSEKCCADATIFLSIFYIAANVGAFLGAKFLCK